MIKVGIVGATGYAGAELTRILLSHPDVEIVSLVSKSYAGEHFSGIYGNLRSAMDEECSAACYQSTDTDVQLCWDHVGK